MHDPDVVAFDIPRPWPQRSQHHDAKPGKRGRWQMRHRHTCFPDPAAPASCGGCNGKPHQFPWWKASSYSKFWTIAGRGYYWPSIVTVWHHDPGGYDCFDKCPRDSHWRWHVHHWHIQVQPLQALRRWALTRCEWCGGRSRRGDYVNVSHSWDGPRGRWWQGAPGLYHGDCSNVRSAHMTCTCESPILEHNNYGRCLICDRFRGYAASEKWLRNAALLRDAVPAGGRDKDRYREIVAAEPTKERSE